MHRVSVIIRCKNEERWIDACLRMVFQQTFEDFEVILVDNKSSDRSMDKAKRFNIKKIIEIDKYLPGKAVNMGIEAAEGEYIGILSAHCIPKNADWLGNLVRNLDEDEKEEIAGVYGRQEPLSFSSDLDKRDLLITFGLDRRIQIKDSFFHNGNSMVRRKVIEKIPFDNEVTNIEDRLWGDEVIKKGFKIVYEPEASVYHYHGIHQSGDLKRAHKIVKIMERIPANQGDDFDVRRLGLNIVAIITARGDPQIFCGKPLIEYTIQRAQESKVINKVVVATDSQGTKGIALASGAEVPFIRPPELSKEGVGVEEVIKYSLEQLEAQEGYVDCVVYLSILQPFRPAFLIDELITLFLREGFDSVLAGYPTYKSCWIRKGEEIIRVDEGFIASSQKQPVHVGYAGLACVTHAGFIRQGLLLGNNVGISETLDFYSTIEVKTREAFELAERVFPLWWKKQEQASRIEM